MEVLSKCLLEGIDAVADSLGKHGTEPARQDGDGVNRHR